MDKVDYIALFLEYLQVEMGLSRNTQQSYARDLRLFCKALGIGELLNKFPYELSGGQKQRTAVGRAVPASSAT